MCDENEGLKRQRSLESQSRRSKPDNSRELSAVTMKSAVNGPNTEVIKLTFEPMCRTIIKRLHPLVQRKDTEVQPKVSLEDTQWTEGSRPSDTSTKYPNYSRKLSRRCCWWTINYLQHHKKANPKAKRRESIMWCLKNLEGRKLYNYHTEKYR